MLTLLQDSTVVPPPDSGGGLPAWADALTAALRAVIPLLASWLFKRLQGLQIWVGGLPDLAKAVAVVALNALLAAASGLVGQVIPAWGAVTPDVLSQTLIGVAATVIYRLARRRGPPQ